MPRHHYVPKFLLRGFADDREQLLVVSRTNLSRTYRAVVGRAAAEHGFYAISSDELTAESRRDHNPEAIEAALAEIESAAAIDVEHIRDGSFALTLDAHYRLVRLAALQLSRVPSFRQDYVDMANSAARKTLELKLSRERVREYLLRRGKAVDDRSVNEFYDEARISKFTLKPSKAHLTQATITIGIEAFMPDLFQRIPKILRFAEPSLLTSDAGAGLWVPGHATPRTAGIANARAVFLPLDRYTALAFMRDGRPSDGVVQRFWADHINSVVAGSAAEWIYQHPDDSLLSRIDLPDRRP